MGPARQQRDFTSFFITIKVFNRRRFGFKAERTHRGWKALPLSKNYISWATFNLCCQIVGAASCRDFLFKPNRNAAIGRKMHF